MTEDETFILNIVNTVFDNINNLRSQKELSILTSVDNSEDYVNVFRKSSILSCAVNNFDETISILSDQILASFENEHISNSTATHLDVNANIVDGVVHVQVDTLYNYLVVAEIGPVIDGDLVIQGSTLEPKYGPALCIVEFAEDEQGPFKEILRIAPWKMLVEQRDVDVSFLIPVSIPKQFLGGLVRATVFVDDAGKGIPYEDEVPDFDLSPAAEGRICAASVAVGPGNHSHGHHGEESDPGPQKVPSEEEPQEEEEGEMAYQRRLSSEMQQQRQASSHAQIVTDVRVAIDFDEMAALQAEGFELICRAITAQGPLDEQEHLWKFYILAAYGDSNEPGVEDVAWIKVLKSLGKVPVLAGYRIYMDHDLSAIDDAYSVYLGVKTSPGARFKQVIMVSSSVDDETHLQQYVSGVRGIYRGAPAEMAKMVGGPCGLILCLDSAEEMHSSHPMSRLQTRASFRADKEEQDMRSDTDLDTEDGKFDDDDESDENALVRLSQQLEELRAQKEGLLAANLELQKKVAILLTREKSIQGQSAATKAIADVALSTGTVPTATADNPEKFLDYNQEREKQYQDTLSLVMEERAKLAKQNKEFDQLALDLQTRLDDKEFKANGIGTSFMQFKKEILLKCENSRTGHKIPKAQISQIEQAEARREEDLEKIRLKNISLRTTYRKLEKALRSREQLAEGLHMIDFEQLKIENQTLIEKIEERSEELAKLKRKKTITVQILTHIREKLRFVEKANSVVQGQLSALEDDLNALRNAVTLEKLSRDAIKLENKDLKARQGFATSDLLLRDFENRSNRVETLRATVTELKERYQILLRKTNKSTISNKSTNSVPSWLFSDSHV
eukprot:CAMPEP_0201094456 /NCGR_PEP_ID=MMETSP0812-20130820/2745_1 /ASSEMBLY_ACC=CAM_ASM_000668 /TAXON_ID=98059 /ORGANISM="Dinobryon sp., Strain UTEXLB2267" /LENGTH=845 /DNA_ID=CAMNT_0047347027 /DNA_START=12 /DNA_END=2549 /DNA_ORIENTATION=+